MLSEDEKKSIMDHCCDRRDDYPFVFTKDYGLDVKVPGHPEYFVNPPQNQNVSLEISTWRGISPDAIHYYGRIRAKSPVLCRIGEDGRVRICGGYICKEWHDMPIAGRKFVGEGYVIEIVRFVTKSECEDDPNRWGIYDPCYRTNAFDTVADVLAIGKKIIAARFPGWEVKVEKLL